jgi:hypothetical protein
MHCLGAVVFDGGYLGPKSVTYAGWGCSDKVTGGDGIESGHAGSGVVPEDLVAQAKAAFADRYEGDLAVLVFDSLVDEGAPATDHLLRFDHPVTRIKLQVAAGPQESELSGYTEPPTGSRVQLDVGTGDLYLAEDVVGGAFTFHAVPHGLVRLHILGSDEDPGIRTDWVRV